MAELKVIQSVAGSGKTRYLVNLLDDKKNYLVLTYTTQNRFNLIDRISKKFGGQIPKNILVMTWYSFAFSICYMSVLDAARKYPYLDMDTPVRAGFNRRYKATDERYYVNASRDGILMDRLSEFLMFNGNEKKWLPHIEKYADMILIDEFQDFYSHDFDLALFLSKHFDSLFVGDFYQHTYATSHDGNKSKGLYDTFEKYQKEMAKRGIELDTNTLVKSWRCSPEVCRFVSDNLGIQILPAREGEEDQGGKVVFLEKDEDLKKVLEDENIEKFAYENSSRYPNAMNMGFSKGLDCFNDVCVLLNKTQMKACANGKEFVGLKDLSPLTRNKLYVAITRAHGNCYLASQEQADRILGIKPSLKRKKTD